MLDRNSWDWETSEKLIADIDEIKKQYPSVHEFVASSNGEQIAVPVKTADGDATAVVNGKPWEAMFEIVWYPRFSPDGRFTALVRADDEWTVAVDGETWEETFEYAWNTQFSRDGKVIAAQVKRENKYTIAVDGNVWSNASCLRGDWP